MLSFLRKNAGTWLIKLLLGAIVVVFVFWGVGSFRNRGEGWAAKIDGEPITLEQYNQAYTQLVEYYRKAYGQQFNEELIKMLNLKGKALDQLIDKQLLLREADRLKLIVTDEELAAAVRAMPVFQEDGLFSAKRYKGVLSMNRMTPESFEASQRESMLIEKLKNLLADGLDVSDPEIQQWYAWRHEKVKVAYILVNPSLLDDITVDDAEIRKYFDEHPAEFQVEEMRKARYVTFSAAQFAPSVSISDADVREYYESHSAQFDKPKTVEARHILFRVEKDASEADVEKAKQKALDVMKQAKAGKDFAELARKYSEDPAKANGGYLGVFKKEDMVAPFSEKAFSMKPGEISDPVRTTYGWHIIKVEKVNEAHRQSLEEASASIRDTLKNEQAKNDAFDAASAFSQAVVQMDGFEKAADAKKYSINTTEPFGRSGVSGMPESAKFAETAFSLDLNGVSDVIALGPSTYAVLQVTQIQPEHTAEFDTVRDKARTLALKAKQDQAASAMADSFQQSLKDGKSMADIAVSKGVTKGETEFFEKNSSISGIGFEPVLNHAAFGLSEEKKMPEKPLKGEKGYYVVLLAGKQLGAMDGLDKEKSQIKEFLLNQKQARILEQLLQELKRKSDIRLGQAMAS